MSDSPSSKQALRSGIAHAIDQLSDEVERYDDDSGNPPHELTFIRGLIAHLNGTLLEADRAADEPKAPHSGDHLQRVAAWLAKEMPPGTEIGDPLWWAPRILAAACVTADELPEPPSALLEEPVSLKR